MATDFEAFDLAPNILRAVQDSGYTQPTPIQSKVVPALLSGRDVLAQAPTGTGKTAAFALPSLSRIELGHRHPRILVLTPTRELAIQVADAFTTYGAHLDGLRVQKIYGGAAFYPQKEALSRGADVVVGTPGRVLDHIRRKTLNLSEVKTLVLDEADEMLRMGFIEDVELILSETGAGRQTALLSATMPRPIQKIAETHLRDPVRVHVASETLTSATITQQYVIVRPYQKYAVLRRFIDAWPEETVLVFARTKASTEDLAQRLASDGVECSALNGDFTQAQREQTVEALRAGRIRVLVATDVAARGLDVSSIRYVVNFDLPRDAETYTHRIGRTGRAGQSGLSLSLVLPREQRQLKMIERATQTPVAAATLPTVEDINRMRMDRFKARITASAADDDLEMYERITQKIMRRSGVSAEKLAAGLAKALHAGDELLDERDEILLPTSSSDRGGGRRDPRLRAFGARNGDGRHRDGGRGRAEGGPRRGRPFKDESGPGRGPRHAQDETANAHFAPRPRRDRDAPSGDRRSDRSRRDGNFRPRDRTGREGAGEGDRSGRPRFGPKSGAGPDRGRRSSPAWGDDAQNGASRGPPRGGRFSSHGHDGPGRADRFDRGGPHRSRAPNGRAGSDRRGGSEDGARKFDRHGPSQRPRFSDQRDGRPRPDHGGRDRFGRGRDGRDASSARRGGDEERGRFFSGGKRHSAPKTKKAHRGQGPGRSEGPRRDAPSARDGSMPPTRRRKVYFSAGDTGAPNGDR